MTITIDDALGTLEVTVARPGGGSTTVGIDVCAEHYNLIDLYAASQKDGGKPYVAALAEWAATLGFHGVTARTALELQKAVFARSKELEGKSAPAPSATEGAPGSTASTPGT